MWKEIPGQVNSQNDQLTNTTCEIYFYGVTGQKLETYTCSYTGGGFVMSLEGINVYFGKKLLQSKGAWVATDKLGSVRYSSSLGAMSYYPYGEERENPNTANGVEKFGTYTRDAVGQDYAEQRYYNSSIGAFWSPDPGGIKTADPKNPGSWNRYPYVTGDPANHSDPNGTEQDSQCGPGWQTDPSLEGPCCDPSQNNFLGAAPDPACYAGVGGGDDGDEEEAYQCDPDFATASWGGFTAADVNYAARAVFAESSGNYAEDIAIADVIVNRLNNKLFSRGTLTTLTAVVDQPGQFVSVTPPGPNAQFTASAPGNYESLDEADCNNLATAIVAMETVAEDGATATYNTFRAASSPHAGTTIGGSKFWTQVPASQPKNPRKKKKGPM